jgi:hypothetical protein
MTGLDLRLALGAVCLLAAVVVVAWSLVATAARGSARQTELFRRQQLRRMEEEYRR